MTPAPAPIPDGWQEVRLGDVAEVAFSSVDKKTIGGEVPVELCNYTDVFYNRRILPDMPFMAATASPAECDRWSLRQGDVLFTKDSETPDEIGIPSYVVEDMPGVLCGYHVALARPAPRSASGSFLARALGSRASAQKFARIANGVTRFGLTLGATRSLPILLPPLPEQRAIAAVLDSIDEAIERTEEVIAATERLRDALLRELLTRGLPGRHSEWADVPGLGTVPACWDVVRLGDVAASITSGSRAWSEYFSSEGALFVRSQDIVGGRVDRSDAIRVRSPADAEAERTRIDKGDLLISITGEPGKVTVADDTLGEAYVSQHVALVRLAELGLSAFVATFLRGPLGQEQFQRLSYGQTRPGLNLSDVAAARLALPPLDEQQALVAALDGVDGTIRRAREERARLHSLQESAAEALLTGRVRARMMGAT